MIQKIDLGRFWIIGILASSLITSVSLISFISCTDCNDCGPTGYTKYHIENGTGEDIKLYWFGNTTLPSNVVHEFTVNKGDRVLLYESSLTGTSGLLSVPPFNSSYPYDSVKFENTSILQIFSANDCGLSNNPLCEENHSLLKSVDTDKQKIEEWEFVIK